MTPAPALTPGQNDIHRLDAFMALERIVYNAISAAKDLPQPERSALLFYAQQLAAELLPLNPDVLAVLRDADVAADHGRLVATADEALAAWRSQRTEPTGALLELRRQFAASASRLQLPNPPIIPDQTAS